MKAVNLCPAKTLHPGDTLHGFYVLRAEELPDIRVTVYELEHEQTGAKLLHLHCDDRENLFSVGFRTPPSDSTGVPHILEHSVLAGSAAYPVKDAFNELAKGTLQTFINAFTFPDKTVYPVASQVKADFFNLTRVYCDLVFKPRLSRETFYQEGHHLELEDPDDAKSGLTVSGIVFNEMRGAYSSPDSLMYKYLQESLYPDTPYAHDSGGDPRVIPTLTYDQLKAFHQAYYSPSNAYFFIYGDIPTKEHLAFLEEVLSGFERIDIETGIAGQPRADHPARIHGYFPVAMDESLNRKTAINIAWMMAESTDYETVLILEILSEALVGSAAGPLRKALIDSALGEDLSPVTGFVSDLKQTMFAIGLRGSDPEHTDQVVSIVIETLKRLAEKGIERNIIEGALHQIEFSGKEIVRRTMPYAITLMQRAYTTWLYDGDPLIVLNFPKSIEDIRQRWALEPDLFKNAIQEWFLENNHRVISVVEPNKSLTEERETEFRGKMAKLKATLNASDIKKIQEDVQHLRLLQSEPDSPKALATLPELKREDIPREIEIIPTEKLMLQGIPVLKHEIFANGIVYLELAFDISDISEEYQSYLPIMGKLMAGMGAAGLGYEEIAKRIALRTGGIGCHLNAGMKIDGQEHWQKMIFSLRVLHRNIPEAVKIAKDLISEADFGDRSRMRDLLLEARNRLRAAVIPSGHLFAKRTAAAGFNIPAYRDEQWNGREQLSLLTEICSRMADGDYNSILEKISYLYKHVFQKSRMLINMTGDADGLSLLYEETARMLSSVQEGNGIGSIQKPKLNQITSGVSIPAEVCYVAKVVPAAFYKNEKSAALFVLSRLLSNNYLYNRIRVQGGAYGGMSQYDPSNGLFSFLSYRDPNLIETLKVYESASDYVEKGVIDTRELEKAVIGAIGQLDRPIDPAGKGYAAMIRYFSGLTDDLRWEFRNRLLETTPEAINEAANIYLKPDTSSGIAAYAPHDRLQKANDSLQRKLKIENLP
jgi:hypothetical protein